MVMDKKAQILTLTKTIPGWDWTPTDSAWVHIERQKKNRQNLFSRIGIGAVSVLISMHPRTITPHQAINCGGRHFFLTAIDRLSPVSMEVTAAEVTPQICTAIRTSDISVGKIPDYLKREIARFPAVLTEKYLGFEQTDPMARTTSTFVLVTPKPILLEVHDIVKIGPTPANEEEDQRLAYVVKVCHTLDEFKNEYEITRKDDV